jgi:hypothetical protein
MVEGVSDPLLMVRIGASGKPFRREIIDSISLIVGSGLAFGNFALIDKCKSPSSHVERDSDEPVDPRFDFCLFFDLTKHRMTRGLIWFELAPWQIPEIHIASMAQ